MNSKFQFIPVRIFQIGFEKNETVLKLNCPPYSQSSAQSVSSLYCQYPSNSTLTTVIGSWSRRYRFVFLMTLWLFFPLVILITFHICPSPIVSWAGQPWCQGPIGNLRANVSIQTLLPSRLGAILSNFFFKLQVSIIPEFIWPRSRLFCIRVMQLPLSKLNGEKFGDLICMAPFLGSFFKSLVFEGSWETAVPVSFYQCYFYDVLYLWQ